MRFDVNIYRRWIYQYLQLLPIYSIEREREVYHIECLLEFDIHFVLNLPPLIEHINWVKRAWGLLEPVKPKPPYSLVVESDDGDFDPIPF